jgi:hypothetical protein
MKKVASRKRTTRPVIGWREWVELPELGVRFIKAKIDTGARTSALHALELEPFRRKGQDWIRFQVHPLQKDRETTVVAQARLIDYRDVKSSNGRISRRPVIQTSLQLLDLEWPIELTLVNRDQMGFRLLLGRTALRNRLLVDCSASYCDSSRCPER